MVRRASGLPVLLRLLGAVALTAVLVTPVSASQWGFPWRGTVPVTVTIADHTAPEWRPFLELAAAEWSVSPVLDVVLLPSDGKCSDKGKVTICAGAYGQGDLHWGWTVYDYRRGQMVDAAVYLNDSYLTTEFYRQHVACHEISHALGILAEGGCAENGSWTGHPTAEDYARLLDVYGNA